MTQRPQKSGDPLEWQPVALPQPSSCSRCVAKEPDTRPHRGAASHHSKIIHNSQNVEAIS